MTRTWLTVFAFAALVCTAVLLPATSQSVELARTGQQTLLQNVPSDAEKPLVPPPDGPRKLPYAMKGANPVARSGFLSWFTAVLKPVVRVGAGDSAASRVSTATIGIRGLANDGALAAKSNSEELQKLKLYSVSRLDAEDFGNSAQLTQRTVAYID